MPSHSGDNHQTVLVITDPSGTIDAREMQSLVQHFDIVTEQNQRVLRKDRIITAIIKGIIFTWLFYLGVQTLIDIINISIEANENTNLSD